MTKPVTLNSGKAKAAAPKPKSRTTIRRKSKSRQEQLKTLLWRKNGATSDKLQSAFGWKPHSVRAAVCSLRKSGEKIERIQTASGTAYRIVLAGSAK